MGMIKCGKIWHCRYYRHGKRYSVSLKTRDRVEAERRAARILQEIESGEFDARRLDTPLAVAAQQFLDRMKPRWSVANYSIRRDHLKHLVAFYGATFSLEGITSASLDQYVKHRSGAVSNETINKEVCTLRMLVRVVTERLIRFVKLPTEKTPQRHLSEGEAEKLLKACKGRGVSPDLYDIVVVALDTGMRRRELFGVTPGHLNVEKRELTVPAPKTHNFRVIPLTQRAFDILRLRARRRLPQQPFFSRADGTLQAQHLRMPLIRAYRRAGLAAKRPWHTLRHTFATRLLERGAPIYEIKLLLGHSSLSVTEMYAHLQPRHLHGTIELLQGHGKTRKIA